MSTSMCGAIGSLQPARRSNMRGRAGDAAAVTNAVGIRSLVRAVSLLSLTEHVRRQYLPPSTAGHHRMRSHCQLAALWRGRTAQS